MFSRYVLLLTSLFPLTILCQLEVNIDTLECGNIGLRAVEKSEFGGLALLTDRGDFILEGSEFCPPRNDAKKRVIGLEKRIAFSQTDSSLVVEVRNGQSFQDFPWLHGEVESVLSAGKLLFAVTEDELFVLDNEVSVVSSGRRKNGRLMNIHFALDRYFVAFEKGVLELVRIDSKIFSSVRYELMKLSGGDSAPSGIRPLDVAEDPRSLSILNGDLWVLKSEGWDYFELRSCGDPFRHAKKIVVGGDHVWIMNSFEVLYINAKSRRRKRFSNFVECESDIPLKTGLVDMEMLDEESMSKVVVISNSKAYLCGIAPANLGDTCDDMLILVDTSTRLGDMPKQYRKEYYNKVSELQKRLIWGREYQVVSTNSRSPSSELISESWLTSSVVSGKSPFPFKDLEWLLKYQSDITGCQDYKCELIYIVDLPRPNSVSRLPNSAYALIDGIAYCGLQITTVFIPCNEEEYDWTRNGTYRSWCNELLNSGCGKCFMLSNYNE